jgi:glycosyltransferase involved in cell wall biosynthesis
LAQRIVKRASYVLCVSDAEVAAIARAYPGTADRIRTVGIGIDIESIRQSIPFDNERPVVLIMGRLEAYKHAELGLEAFAHSESDAQMIIIGTGSERERLTARIDELGVGDRVRMLGHVDDAEARRWQRTARVVMTLSSAESFGLGAAEAVAAGANVVASDIPAHREVASMVGGVFELVPLGASVERVSASLRRSFAAERERTVRSTLPTWNEVCSRIVDLYEMAQR